MRVFCLSTGRVGSTTFTKSFSHFTNYTSGHETRSRKVGFERLNYPDWHIESDNRLSWFLGELDERFGNEPLYVHLLREFDGVVRSFESRYGSPASIMNGFAHGILMNPNELYEDERRPVAEAYVNTVNSNIRLFLRDKTNVVVMRLENPLPGVREIWNRAEMRGDLDAAMAEWEIRYNRGIPG